MSTSKHDKAAEIWFTAGQNHLHDVCVEFFMRELQWYDQYEMRSFWLSAAILIGFLLATVYGPVWLVLVAPFILIGATITSGIRSLWS